MLQSKIFQNIFILFLVILLALLLWWGWNNGTQAAESKTIIKNAEVMTQGFDYFYKDQNRYPTTGEFTEDNLMRTYIANYPPQNFTSETCKATYDYFSASPQTYELRMCLPKAVNGYQEGWNRISVGPQKATNR